MSTGEKGRFLDREYDRQMMVKEVRENVEARDGSEGVPETYLTTRMM